MSVASTNPFQLLGDDGADAAPIKAAAPAAAQPKQQQRTVPGAARPAQKTAEPASDAPLPREGDLRQPRNSRGDRERGGRGGSRGGRSGERGGRGRGGKSRGRQFDRHSGTGRQETEKSQRMGAGGLDGESEVKNEEGAKEDAKEDAKEAKLEDKADAAAARAAAEEEDEKTLTLDQYLARQKEQREKLGVSAAPRTVEADEQSYGQKLEKGEGEAYFAGQQKKTAAPKAHKTKQTIEFEPVYESPAASRGGRPERGRGAPRGAPRGRGERGRGAGRGRGGRGGASAPRSSAPVVNLEDKSAFPSLG